MRKKIFCTVGPSSLNKKFLKFSNGNVDLLRINLSHVKLENLPKLINFIRKYSSVPICIDTEGAQIRTKVRKYKFFKKKSSLKIYKEKGNFKLYPENVYDQLKKNDILDIGFSGLEVKVRSKNESFLVATVLKDGLLETNKGVHLKNRKIKLEFVTYKDKKAIKIAKKYKIKNFALSFTNSADDVKKFNNLIKHENKIFKLETKSALSDLNNILKLGKNFLIDRGDLSKDISIELIPVAQRQITKLGKKKNKNIFVATNFLESMLLNNLPTRGEVNDIYNTLEIGAKGLVLAAETAVGKFPVECVLIIKKIMKTFNRASKNF